MTRTLKAISALVLGGMFLFGTAACEDKECKDALAAAKTAAETAAKSQASLTAELATTKSKLASAEASLAATKKELEAAKAPKPEEAAAPAATVAKNKKGKKK